MKTGKPNINTYPVTDSRTYLNLDGSTNWQKYANDLDGWITSQFKQLPTRERVIEILQKYERKIDDSDYHDTAVFDCDYKSIADEFRSLSPVESKDEQSKKVYPEEFVDYMMKSTWIPDPDNKDKFWDVLVGIGEVSYSLEQVYQYCINNIAKKVK